MRVLTGDFCNDMLRSRHLFLKMRAKTSDFILGCCIAKEDGDLFCKFETIANSKKSLDIPATVPPSHSLSVSMILIIMDTQLGWLRSE